jgi:hypothetical protein
MMIYPELMLDVARDRQREFVAEADRGRVLRSARRRSRSGPKVRSDSSSLSPAPRAGATVT